MKEEYTIVIVTHNMQQAARVSDYTAFLMIDNNRSGRLVEFGRHHRIFTRPEKKQTEDYVPAGLAERPIERIRMTREILERRLNHLRDEVLNLGSMVEQSAVDVVFALRHLDCSKAEKIEKRDEYINQRRFAIEEECLTIMATQQPMARDLRLLAAILEVIPSWSGWGITSRIAHIIPLLGTGTSSAESPRPF